MSCWKGVRALWLSLVSLLFCNEGDYAERLRAEIRYGSQDWIKKKNYLRAYLNSIMARSNLCISHFTSVNVRYIFIFGIFVANSPIYSILSAPSISMCCDTTMLDEEFYRYNEECHWIAYVFL